MRLTMDDLACNILPGRVTDPRPGIDQAVAAEKLGLGAIYLSERWETKELGSLMGAISQRTERIRLVAGLTHFGTRHPLALAGLASTMQLLSNNRFVLGFGRSAATTFRRLGIPMYKIADMAVYADILRKLWRGETITYEGPIGNFPQMKLALPCENPPPLLLGAVGPKTLALAGAHFDAVVLHPFLTTEGVTRSVAIVREAAERVGRDPASIKVSATVVVALDTIPDETRADILDARAVSYFMHRDIGGALVAMNGWDMKPVEDLIASGVGDADFQLGGTSGNRQSMASQAHLMPPEWLTTGAAVGSAETCVDRLAAYQAAGADEVLIHGAAPEQQAELAGVLRARAN